MILQAATDAMEALTLGGVDTVLFLKPPSRELLDHNLARLEPLA